MKWHIEREHGNTFESMITPHYQSVTLNTQKLMIPENVTVEVTHKRLKNQHSPDLSFVSVCFKGLIYHSDSIWKAAFENHKHPSTE